MLLFLLGGCAKDELPEDPGVSGLPERATVVLDTAGSLDQHLSDAECRQLIGLTVVGPINAGDLALIRRMAGVDRNGCPVAGYRLAELDLGRAEIRAGGGCYCGAWTTEENRLGVSAFQGCTSLRMVILPASLEAVGANAFSDCTGLETIVMGDAVSELGDQVFSGCGSLRSVELPDGIRHLGRASFQRCESLQTVSLPSGLETIGNNAFDGCVCLNGMSIPSTVYAIGSEAFRNCRSYSSLTTLPDGIEELQTGTFYGSGIVNFVLPDHCAKLGDEVFAFCPELLTLHIGKGLSTVGIWLVYGSEKMTDFIGSGTGFEAVDGILYGKAKFNVVYCPNGKSGSIDILDTAHIVNRTAFAGCDKLTRINFLLPPTSLWSHAFYGCSSLAEITNLGEGITRLDAYAFYGCSQLREFVVPSTVTSSEVIPEYLFAGCTALESVVFNRDFRAVNQGAFMGCASLSRISLPASVATIGQYAFDGCRTLTDVVLPESLSELGKRAFGDCVSLVSVSLPSALVSMAEDAFEGCSLLSSVTIPEGNSQYRIQDGAIYSADGYTLIRLPEGVSGDFAVLSEVTAIAEGAFSGCRRLASVTVPATVRQIGAEAFRCCESLSAFAFPEGVTEIERGVLSGCSSLVQVVIPEGVTAVGSRAFSGCNSLSEVELPTTVTSVQTGSFAGCTTLCTLRVHSETPPTVGVGAFEGVDQQRCALVVPSGLSSVYRQANGWCGFQNIVENATL